jgi:hypothetical protein
VPQIRGIIRSWALLGFNRKTQYLVRMKDQIPIEMGRLFSDFLASQVKTTRLINAAVLELHRFPQSINLMQKVDELRRFKGDDIDDDATKRAEDDAPVIKDETDKGFPFFYGLATVAIWGGLEAFIEDLLALCLENDSSLMSLESVAKIKVSISRFEAMPLEQRRHYIIDTIERDMQSKYKQGVSRFESLLGVFGLGGSVDDNTKRTLLEIAGVRNVLVHRSGIADERLVTTCPWLGIKIGQTVRVDRSTFSRYSLAPPRYAAIVFSRVTSHFGGNPESVDKFIQSLT